MNLDSFKKRTIRILTTPPEALYALSKHWAVLACCLSLGVIISAAKVATDAPVYKGTATLIVNPQSSIVSGERSRSSAGDVARFLNEQATILRSTTTVRDLVKNKMKLNVVVEQDQNPEAKNYTGLRRVLNTVRQKVNDLKSWLESPHAIQDTGMEVLEQRAIRGFLGRSQVLPDARNNTIRLIVYGVDRNVLLQEVKAWISAYQERVEGMHREGREAFITTQVEQYRERENQARRLIAQFEEAHPLVSTSNRDYHRAEIERWRIARQALEDRLHFGDLDRSLPVTTGTIAPVDTEVEGLKRRIAEARFSMIQALSQGATADSKAVRTFKNIIELLEAELAAKGVDPEPEEGATEEDLQAKIRARIQQAETKLLALRTTEREIEDGLDELSTLEDEHRRLKEKRQLYEEMSNDEIDKALERFMVKIVTGDNPEVSTSPANARQHGQVLIGSAAGLFIGLFLALFLEVLCGRVRYRNDVTHHFGIPVVGVIPKR